MTLQELQQDAIKRRKEVLEAILAEFEEFDINYKCTNAKNYEFVNIRVPTLCFFFDFRIDLMNDKLEILAYTHKQLTNLSGCGVYPLTMANIDELLMAIQSYNNVYIPKFS